MSTSFQIQDSHSYLEVPEGLHDLGRFRQWVRSESFPDQGRIDWIRGEVWIDMLGEDINAHGSLKSVIGASLHNCIQARGEGLVLTDAGRVTSLIGGISAQPDVVVLLTETVSSGGARLVSGVDGQPLEIEGAPDLVVECISKSSVRKDRRRLPAAYHAAGIPEFWLTDGRIPRGQSYGSSVVPLEVHVPGAEAYRRVEADAEGFSHSPLLGCAVRIVRVPLGEHLMSYRLETR